MKFSQLLVLLQLLLTGFVNAEDNHIPCPKKCGNVDIPYPFGTEESCYLDKSYRIECNSSTQIPQIGFIPKVDVMEINLEGHLIRVALPIAYTCYNKQGKTTFGSVTAVNTSRFPFSSTLNSLTAVGCDIEAHLVVAENAVLLNCQSDCEHDHIRNGSCLGHGCCQATLPQGMKFAAIIVVATENRSKVRDNSTCGYGFIAEKGKYNFSTTDLITMSKNMSFSAVLDWSVEDTTCEEAQKDNTTYRCHENSVCYNGEGGLSGYRCECAHGYRGNPYVKTGCQDVNECESAELNDCQPGLCKNTYGSYSCVCPKGFQGDAKKGGECVPLRKPEDRAVIAGVGEGVAGAVVTMIFVYWGAKRRIRIKGRKDFFKKNGGIMLQKMLFTCEDPINKGKIFTEDELKKATNNFHNAKVIGQGGYGTVYVGTLANKEI